MVQALIVRQLRLGMNREGIEKRPIYPENARPPILPPSKSSACSASPSARP
jgi:hypothetical protein